MSPLDGIATPLGWLCAKIIDVAERIGTYDISIRPHEDCCTIFTPKKPATKPKTYKCEEFESQWDYATQVQECIDQMETIVVDANYKNDDEMDLF